jgi:hypothetical protein
MSRTRTARFPFSDPLFRGGKKVGRDGAPQALSSSRALPGIGPLLTQRIIGCRTTQGSGALISNSRLVPISTLNRGR